MQNKNKATAPLLVKTEDIFEAYLIEATKTTGSYYQIKSKNSEETYFGANFAFVGIKSLCYEYRGMIANEQNESLQKLINWCLNAL